MYCVFLQAEDGIRDLVRSRGLGDVYKRQALQIKRYIQMHLDRNKTDKKDPKHICMYGIERNPEPYQMPDMLYFECKSLNNAIHTLTQEITAFKNKIHALQKLNLDSKVVIKSDQSILKDCLLYTSDAADERSSVDLGGRRIIKKKQK